MAKKKDDDLELIKKAARLLKGETLTKEQKNLYTLHAKRKNRIKRLKIYVQKKNQQWSIDLADLNELSGYNNQYRYILVCVDVATRYAFVKMLKTKTAKNVSAKFEELILENGAPQKIHADEGTEFNDIRKKLGPKYNFKLFHTENREIKATHAERFIQTLKEMIRRTLTVLSGYRFVKYLPTIIERYNESPHRGIYNAKPVDLYIHGKIPKFFSFKILQSYLNGSQATVSLLRMGQTVRIARVKNSTFEKASLRRWGKEIFIIDKVLITDPVTYTLKDKNNENITGIFYREELQPI
jgi:transposase-like protein